MTNSAFRPACRAAGVVIVAISALLSAASPARAATFVVTHNFDRGDGNPGDGVCEGVLGICSLRTAIEEANALPGVDTIVLPAGQMDMVTPLAVTESVIVTGPDMNTRTVIDWGNRSAGFTIANGATLTMSNVVVQHANGQFGGAFYVDGGLTLQYATIRDNRASDTGGAIYANAGTLDIKDTEFTGNYAHSEGGAMYASNSTVILTRVLVDGNTAEFCCGGGLAFSTVWDDLRAFPVHLTDVTVTGNTSGSGGGIFYHGADLHLDFLTIANNTSTNAHGVGGGLEGDPMGIGALTIGNTIIANNRQTAAGSGSDCSVGTVLPTWGGSNRGHNLIRDASGCNIGLGSTDITGVDPVLGPLQMNFPGLLPTRMLLPGSPAIDAGACTEGVIADGRGVERLLGPSCDIGAYELAPGTTPLPFSLGDRSDMPMNTWVLAPAAVRPSGLSSLTPVWIDGGELSLDGHTWTSQLTAIMDGQQVFVRVHSASTPLTATHATLYIGGISATFTVTTVGVGGALTVDLDTDSVDAAPGDGVCADVNYRCSLRAAVMEAEALRAIYGSTPAIHVPAGTYPLSVANTVDGSHAIDVHAPQVVVIGEGAATTAITGRGRSRIFEVLTDRSAESSLELHGLTLRDGSADEGGAILNQGHLAIADAAITTNTAGTGGAVVNYGSLSLANATLSGNTASHPPDAVVPSAGGGAIANEQGATASLTNVTISDNTAAGYGGAIVNAGGVLTLANVTVSGNSGIVGGIANAAGQVSIRNTILARNFVSPDALDPTTAPDCTGAIGSTGANLVGNASTCTFAAAAGDLAGTGAQPLDPVLGMLTDNGGPTLTRALLPGSPAIDAGTCALTEDQRGVSRPQGAACDIGAFESKDTTAPVLHVPGDLVVEATGFTTPVSFDVTATDAQAGLRPVACAPASGSSFHLTTTVVTCTATDLNGNTATGTFNVTVRDTTPPVILTPGDLTAHATLATGAKVLFTVKATDLVGVGGPACAPESGAIFPTGTTTVNCWVTDTSGNGATAAFTVTVVDDRTPTTVTVASSAKTALFGQRVTFTATVSPSTATGGVLFLDGGVPLGFGQLAGGHASITTALLAAGAHAISAFYASDAADRVGRSEPLAQTVTAVRSGGLAPASVVAAGGAPQGLALGDFDEDGRVDLLVASPADSHVRVLLNGSDGSLRRAGDYWTFSVPGPRAVAVGDFNRDGHADYASVDSGVVFWADGDGHGAFAGSRGLPASASSGAIAAVDLNEDGLLDLAIANGARNGVQVLLGRADTAEISSPVGVAMPAGNHVPVLADVTGDGHLDLVTDTPAGIAVAAGRGDGTFAAAAGATDGSGSGAFGIAAADFNGDGRVDLAITNAAANTVDVFVGAGDGTFQHGGAYPVGSAPGFVAAGDLDGDGRIDLAVANTASNDVSVLAGDGTGAFHSFATYPVGHAPAWIAIADFNGDGRADLAVTNSGDGTVTILAGTHPVYPLTVTALDASRVYGDANPAFAGVVLGLQDGDAIDVQYLSAAEATSPVGTYAIVPAISDPNGVLANYDVTVVNGRLTVAPAPLTIAAEDKIVEAGSPLPVLTAAYTGFVNGDTSAQLAAPVTLATTATAASTPGSYPITASAASAANYVITFVPGTLIIQDTTPPALVLPADITTTATSQAGAPVAFVASGADVVDGAVDVACTPASGAIFPVGTTTVTCAAADSHGNEASGTFAVSVQAATAAEVIDVFSADIASSGARLDADLRKIERALARGRNVRVCADVEKLERTIMRRKKLTPAERATLLADAQWLAFTLGCGGR